MGYITNEESECAEFTGFMVKGLKSDCLLEREIFSSCFLIATCQHNPENDLDKEGSEAWILGIVSMPWQKSQHFLLYLCHITIVNLHTY